MPEVTYDEDGNLVEQSDSEVIKEIRNAQREADKRAKAAEGRARSAELKVAMNEAGVKLNPQTKFFLTHYEGETDIDSVKAALAEHGFVASEEESEEQQQRTEEAKRQEAISKAAAGGDQGPPPSDEPWNDELADLAKKMNAGTDSYQVMAEAEAIMRKHGRPVYTGE